jgi:hypothetical protein
MTALAQRLWVALWWTIVRDRGEKRSKVKGLPELAAHIRALYQREGISEEEAIVLAKSSEEKMAAGRVERVLSQIFSGEYPDDARAAVYLAHDLEERFAEPLPSDNLVGPTARVGKTVATGLGCALWAFCMYFVLGGLLEGESERFSGLPGPVALFFFVVMLAFLGLFEALHTSVTQLRLADLRGLVDTYPRAYELHRHFRDEKGISRVLAGRQIVVVISVFIVAGLSSFPEMAYLPFTQLPLPGYLHPAIELGIPGALVVLWVAQLAPQFYATRHAVELMNTRAAGWGLELAFALEAVGIAVPGGWLVKGDGGERIPVSPALQWEQDADAVGEGLLSLTRRWRCGETRSRFQGVSTTAIRGSERIGAVDSNVMLPGAPSSLSITSDIAGADGAIRLSTPTDYVEEALPAGDRLLQRSVVPAAGSLIAGDRAQVAVDAEFSGCPERDAVYTDRRSRFLLWRLSFEDQPLHVSAVRLRMYRVGSGLEDLSALGEEIRLEPEKGSSLPTFSYSVAFPPPNTLFVFTWEVAWR